MVWGVNGGSFAELYCELRHKRRELASREITDYKMMISW
jgi:hypothetical protein